MQCRWYNGRDGFAGWLRLWENGIGIQVKSTPPLFSERNGYNSPTLKIGKWRLFILKPV